MNCILFDGKAFAHTKELELRERVENLRVGDIVPRVVTFTFQEDEGSAIYTRLKKEAANRIGISYEPEILSLQLPLEEIKQKILNASSEEKITGIMIQKPAKTTWYQFQEQTGWDEESKKFLDFSDWWTALTETIAPQKDVDCLTSTHLGRIRNKENDPDTLILPATVRAVRTILFEAKNRLDISDKLWSSMDILVIGRSDIVGNPLTWVMGRSHEVVQYGKDDFMDSIEHRNAKRHPSLFDIVISATGQTGIITGEHVKPGAIVIDVGSPRGDVEKASVIEKAAFLTPVPGGVGPVTVISLMENILHISV